MNKDDIFRNYSFDSTNSSPQSASSELDNKIFMTGGDKTNIVASDFPSGGFPPIFICKQDAQITEKDKLDDDQTKREYKTHKSSVSIKSLLEKRRSVTPFIKI